MNRWALLIWVFLLPSGASLADSDLSGMVPPNLLHGGTYIRPFEFPGPKGPAHVIDGDTIKIGKTSIRLLGVDAPEKETEQGQRSKIALRRIIGGHDVKCEDTGKTSYKRMVAQCYVHYRDQKLKTDIGEELIRQGWAHESPSYISGDTADRYAAAQLYALEEGNGMWAQPLDRSSLIQAIITAIGIAVTAFVAAYSARRGAITGAATQAELTAEAAQKKLDIKRQRLRAFFAQEILGCLLLVEDRTRLLFRKMEGGDQDILSIPILRFDHTLLKFTAETCQRMMAEVHILDPDQQVAISRSLHALMKLHNEIEKPERYFPVYSSETVDCLYELLIAYKGLSDKNSFSPKKLTNVVKNLYVYLQYQEERDLGRRVYYTDRRQQLIDGFAPDGDWGDKIMVPIWAYSLDVHGQLMVDLEDIKDADFTEFSPDPWTPDKMFI